MYFTRGRRSIYRIILGILISGLFLFYNNCGVIESKFESTTKSSKSLKAFSDSKFKINLENSLFTKIADQKNEVFEKESEFLLIVSSSCLADQNTHSPIAKKAYSQNINWNHLESLMQLSTFSLKYTLESDTDILSFKILAENDPCLIGITNNQILESNSISFNDPYYSKTSYLKSIGFENSYDFFSHPTLGASSNVVISILDSGLDLNNPDLKNSLTSPDSNGFQGYNLILDSGNFQDDFGHGTFIASLLTAKANNGHGIVGVKPEHLKIYPIKIANSSGSSSAQLLAKGIDLARTHHVDLITISMSLPFGVNQNDAVLSSIQAAVSEGIFIAVSAANDGKQISETTGPFPAAHCKDIDGCMTVGSIKSFTSTRSNFSNYSSTYVEMMAPGEGGILSSVLNNKYEEKIGTSFSTPLVAGSAALVISFLKTHNITYTPALIETILKNSAQKNTSLAQACQNGNSLNLISLQSYLTSIYLSPVDGGFDEK